MSATPDHTKGHPMTGMTPERLAEIRTRAEVATEGPWGHHPAPKGRGQRVTNKDGATLFVNERPGQMRARVDATFIAAARTDVPDLVAEVRVLTTAVNALGHAHDARLAEVQRLTNDLAVTEGQAIDRDEAATILAQQIEKVRALHREAHAIFSWQSGLRYEDPCPDCHGAAGVHPCGCWTDQQVEYVCAECHRTQGDGPPAAYPCPTLQALDD